MSGFARYEPPLSFGHFPRSGEPCRAGHPLRSRFAHTRPLTLREGEEILWMDVPSAEAVACSGMTGWEWLRTWLLVMGVWDWVTCPQFWE